MKANKNSIGRNIFHLFYSTAFASVLNAASLIILASYLHAGDYGRFSVVLAIAMIMAYLTEAGLNQLVLREGAKKDAPVPLIIASFIKLRFGLMLASLLIGFLFIHMMYGGSTKLVMTAYSLIIPLVFGMALQSISTTYFQMMEKMQYSGFIRIISSSLLVLVILLGKWFGMNHFVLFFLYGCAYLIAGCFGMFLMKRTLALPRRKPIYKGLYKHWGPFMATGLLFILLPQIGPIVLEKVLPLSAVGFFAVACRIPQALQQLFYVIAGAFFPVLFRLHQAGDVLQHVRKSVLQVKLMALTGMFTAIPFYYLAAYVIRILFGEAWMAAAPLLQILALMLLMQGCSIAIGDGLTTKALQTRRMAIQAVSVVFGIIFYIICSRIYGLPGAAWAGVVIEGIQLAGFILCHPDRAVLCKRAIVPYLIYFFGGLFILHIWLSSLPFAAAGIHVVLVIGLVFLDRECREKIMTYVLKKKGRSGEVRDGIS